MDKYPQLIEPLLFYVLHRASFVINDPAAADVLKIFELDEAWRFFKVPTVLSYLSDGARTWRKKEAVIIMATQSLEEVKQASGLLSLVKEQFPTKIFLANPGMDRELYADTFGLNSRELDLIASLALKRDGLIKTTKMAKKFKLSVDPTSYWLYTNSPDDNRRFTDALAKYGFDKALEILAARS
jgi:type IV secretion system protein VirB4